MTKIAVPPEFWRALSFLKTWWFGTRMRKLEFTFVSVKSKGETLFRWKKMDIRGTFRLIPRSLTVHMVREANVNIRKKGGRGCWASLARRRKLFCWVGFRYGMRFRRWSYLGVGDGHSEKSPLRNEWNLLWKCAFRGWGGCPKRAGGLRPGFAFTAPGRVHFLEVDAGWDFGLVETFVGEGAVSLPFGTLDKALATLKRKDTGVYGIQLYEPCLTLLKISYSPIVYSNQEQFS